MEYEYVADADLKAEAKRRGAELAASQAVLLEMEEERLKRVKDGNKVPGRKQAATQHLPIVTKQAKQARKKADKLIETSGLDPTEIDEVEQQALVGAIAEQERAHVYRTAEIEQLQDELEVLDDEDEITALEQAIAARQEELVMVEMAHEVLIERRDA